MWEWDTYLNPNFKFAQLSPYRYVASATDYWFDRAFGEELYLIGFPEPIILDGVILIVR